MHSGTKSLWKLSTVVKLCCWFNLFNLAVVNLCCTQSGPCFSYFMLHTKPLCVQHKVTKARLSLVALPFVLVYVGTIGDILGILCQCIAIVMQLFVLDSNARKPDNMHICAPLSQIQVYVWQPSVMNFFDQTLKQKWNRSTQLMFTSVDLSIILI